MAPTETKDLPLIVSKSGRVLQTDTPDGRRVTEYHQSLELRPTEGMDGVIECQSYSDSIASVQLGIYVESHFRTFWDVTSKVHFLFLGSRNESVLPCLFYGIGDEDVKQLAVYRLKANFMLTDGHASNECVNASSTAFLSFPNGLKPTDAGPTIDPSQWNGQDCDEDGFASCSDAFNYALIPADCSQNRPRCITCRWAKRQFYHFILLSSLRNLSVPVEVAHYDPTRGAVLKETIDPNAEYICVKESNADVPNIHAVSYVPLAAEEARVRARITISGNDRAGWHLTCAVNDFSVNAQSKLKVARVPCDSLIACDAIFRPQWGLGEFTHEENFVIHHIPPEAPFYIKVEAPILTETERMVACTGIIFRSTDNSRHYVQEIFHVFKGFDDHLHLASWNYFSEVVMSAKLSGRLQEGEPITVICQIKTFTVFPTIRFVLRYQTHESTIETIPQALENGNVTAAGGSWNVTSVKANLEDKQAERGLTVLWSPQLKEITCEAPQIHRPDWVHVTIKTEIPPKNSAGGLSALEIVGITLGAIIGFIVIVIIIPIMCYIIVLGCGFYLAAVETEKA